MPGDKLLKNIFSILLCMTLLVTGLVLGSNFEQNKAEKENKKETITNIAVVNLDEGVFENKKKVIYSEELIEFPDSNFLTTALEDARGGIEEGRYAAYIMVPTTFSESAVSINSTPQKVTVEYAINSNLRNDISVQTINAVKNFEMLLNVNMSYMYVDAILKEFHTVQDSATTIMSNDNKDLKTLQSIDPNKLLLPLEISEIKPIENNLQEVNLDNLYTENTKVVEEIEKTYEDSIIKGKEEFKIVKASNGTLTQAMSNVIAIFAGIDFKKGDNKLKIEDIEKERVLEFIEYGKEKQITKKNMLSSVFLMAFF